MILFPADQGLWFLFPRFQNVQIGEFLEFDEENWKKYRIMSKMLIFGQTHMKLAVAMEA